MTELVQHSAHIGVIALLVIVLLIRFGWGLGGDLLLAHGGYYLPSLRLEGAGGTAPCEKYRVRR
jgi:hypothetical protein